MNRRWVIGDIHGCADTLKASIEEQIKPVPSDEIYFLGDYIDRGPKSKAVIDYIRALQKAEYFVKPLKGNHEDFLVELYDEELHSKKKRFFGLRNLRGEDHGMPFGGKETLKSFHVQNIKEIQTEYIEWMRALDHDVILEDFILVHAGLNCKIDDPFTDTKSMLWVKIMR